MFMVSGVSVPFSAIKAKQGRQASENPLTAAKLWALCVIPINSSES
jgi:hypothetical protein